MPRSITKLIPATLVLILATPFEPGNATGSASARRATARWAQGHDVFLVDVMSPEGTDGSTIGAMGVTHCPGHPCIAALRLRTIPDKRVTIDPSLENAEVSFTIFGARVRSRWDGREDARADPDGTGDSTTVERAADARGNALGRGLGHSELVIAKMMHMAWKQEPPERNHSPGLVGRSIDGSRCYKTRSDERALTDAMNRSRRSGGIRSLRFDPQLGVVARKHTREMVSHNDLFHTPPPTLARRVTRWRDLGENVGRSYVGPASLHRSFMNSPVHRANIMHRGFRYVGVGTTHKYGRLWATVTFERRRDPGTTLPQC